MRQTWLPSLFATFALLAVSGCASSSFYERQYLPWGCDDLVVVGRVRTLADSPMGDGWTSSWDLAVTIKDVIKGKERRLVVPATGASHARIRDDADLLVVLTRPADTRRDGYVIRTLVVWQSPWPDLERRCIPSASQRAAG